MTDFHNQIQKQFNIILAFLKYSNLIWLLFLLLVAHRESNLLPQALSVVFAVTVLRALQIFFQKKKKVFPKPLKFAFFLLDYGIITYFILITGGNNSPYLLLYFFLVIRGALKGDGSEGFLGAIISSWLMLYFIFSRENFWTHPSFLVNIFSMQLILIIGWLLSKLNRVTSALNLINILNDSFHGGDEFKVSLEKSLDILIKHFDSDLAGIMLFDKKGWVLRYDIIRGELAEKHKGIELRQGEGVPGTCFAAKKSVTTDNLAKDKRTINYNLITNDNLISAVSVPLKIKEEVIGVLNLANASYRKFGSEDIFSLQLLANQIANAYEKAQFEEKDKQLLQRNEAIFETIINGLIVLNKEGKITLFNREAEDIFSISRRDVEGRYFWDVFFDGHKTDQAGNYTSSALEALFTGKKVVRMEKHLKNFKNEKIIVDIESFPLRDENSELSGAVSVYKNITQRHELEDQMQQAEKFAVIGELAAGLAHEIRNPLTAVKGFIQLLHQRTVEEKENQFFEIIVDELDRANNLIKEFLLLAKPSAPRRQPTDLAELLQKTVALMNTKAVLQEINIQLEFKSLPLVKIDLEQIKQVFINLIKNSLEAMPNGGILTIRGRYLPQRKVIQLDFEDSGTGIPKDMLKKVFNPFFTTKDEGSGLGLSVSYQILESHGGKIYIRSRRSGGTIITLLIPE